MRTLKQLFKTIFKYRLSSALTLTSLIVAFLGIIVLSLYVSYERSFDDFHKNINGASIVEVVRMLNKSVLVWLGIAFVISTPIAYYAMDKWLENFTYKTTLSWWIFALAGLTAFIVALLTVSWQSWRAASRNPVEALRYE